MHDNPSMHAHILRYIYIYIYMYIYIYIYICTRTHRYCDWDSPALNNIMDKSLGGIGRPSMGAMLRSAGAMMFSVAMVCQASNA